MGSKALLCLPCEDEIETTIEKKVPESSTLIEKTIRYKNGMQIKLIQDFSGKVVRLLMNCSNGTLWLAEQGVMRRID
jgi:hypothetical protein